MTEALTDAALFELLSLECRVDTDGTVYYNNEQGQMHRVHGPAVEYTSGTCEWRQNGRLHRLDVPAIEYSDGGEWWQNGQLHRPDGPAIDWPDGYRAWFQNGLLHRLDGPALVNADGCCEWFINGESLTQAEWQQAVASMGCTLRDSSGVLGEPQ